jgi:flagellar biosynthesis protein FlhA
VQTTLDFDRLVDMLRADLGPMIVGRICSPLQRLPIATLEAGLEAMIVNGMHDPTTNQPLIEPELARGIGERIGALIAERGGNAVPLTLVVQPRARRALAALLKLRAPACLVLSIAELPASQPIEVVAVIGGEAEPAPSLPSPDHAAIPMESLAA